MSFNIGHASLGAVQGFLAGGPVGAVAGGVAGGFEASSPATGNAGGTAARRVATNAVFDGSGGDAGVSVLAVFGLDSIEKTIEHINPATLETAFKLFA